MTAVELKSWPAWRKTHPDRRIAEILDEVCGIFTSNRTEVVLASHSGGSSLVFGYLNAIDEIPAKITRIAFLDSDYAYDSSLHSKKIIDWLAASDARRVHAVLKRHPVSQASTPYTESPRENVSDALKIFFSYAGSFRRPGLALLGAGPKLYQYKP